MKKCLITVILVAYVLSGCGGGTSKTAGRSRTSRTRQISKVELRDELTRFENVFVASLKQTASDINAADQTRRTQRTNLRMRVRVIDALNAMTSSDDPIVAFLDTWSFVIRLRMYLEGGDGSQLFGERQPIAVDFIKTSESEMIRIAELFLKQDELEQVQRDLEVFARKNPITGFYSNLIVYPTLDQEKGKEETGALMRTLSIPMAPIRAMEGVDNTATAIHNVRNSVERFTDVAEQMPELARWQMTILMDDFEESEMTQSFLVSLNEFSQSSARLVEVLDSMPQELRTELLTVLEESDQTQLQTTLQAAAQTATQANEAAAAWKSASDSIQELVLLFKGKPRDPDAPPGFGMRDFDNMLLNAGQTADKITGTIEQLQETVNSDAKGRIQNELRLLVDHIAWRLFQLALTVFGLALVFCVIKKKLKGK